MARSAETLSRRGNRLSVPEARGRARGNANAPERYMLEQLWRLVGEPPIRIGLWDGTGVGPDSGPYRIRINDRGAFWQLLWKPDMAFGDLYAGCRIETEGDFTSLLEVLFGHLHQARAARPAWLNRLWASRPQLGADEDGARANIHHHYDLGNDFYRLWLDVEAMQYTCAYYEFPDYTLEQAQQAKMEHVCRKLMLRPGQMVYEAGCGWGGLSLYMAREYGVRVRAWNISREQLAFARAEAERQGLADRVEFIEDDYRNINGQCDAFVSVGMLEHVGPVNYAELAQVIDGCLHPQGMGLIHTIGRNFGRGMNGWIEKRIFPGAHPPSIATLMNLFEDGHFSVLDVENLRQHYARTLAHWLERFQTHREQIERDYDPVFARAWHLYLAGSIASFMVGTLQLFQVVFAPGRSNRVPDNRRHLYQAPATRAGALNE